MSPDREPLPTSQSSSQQERWVKLALGAALLLVIAWLYISTPSRAFPAKRPSGDSTSTTSAPEAKRAEQKPTTRSRSETVERRPASGRKPESKPKPTEAPTNEESSDPLIVHNARVTNEDGRIIHRGDVDLRPTIERIDRGKRLRFSHDGSVFENRERRLPNKPSGYYREFIHPTPDDDGPGGQRVVIGRGGETYYTPDHYKTFHRVR
jgi:filamentous hemagglutinin